MKGSLQKKHGKYYVVVYQKDENGKLHKSGFQQESRRKVVTRRKQMQHCTVF